MIKIDIWYFFQWLLLNFEHILYNTFDSYKIIQTF